MWFHHPAQVDAAATFPFFVELLGGYDLATTTYLRVFRLFRRGTTNEPFAVGEWADPVHTSKPQCRSPYCLCRTQSQIKELIQDSSKG